MYAINIKQNNSKSRKKRFLVYNSFSSFQSSKYCLLLRFFNVVINNNNNKINKWSIISLLPLLFYLLSSSFASSLNFEINYLI